MVRFTRSVFSNRLLSVRYIEAYLSAASPNPVLIKLELVIAALASIHIPNCASPRWRRSNGVASSMPSGRATYSAAPYNELRILVRALFDWGSSRSNRPSTPPPRNGLGPVCRGEFSTSKMAEVSGVILQGEPDATCELLACIARGESEPPVLHHQYHRRSENR